MSEKTLHLAVCDYIRLRYPNVIFTSDLSGLKLSIGMAKDIKKMRSSNGIPDILIFEPRDGWHGLFIELKKEGEKLYKKDGTLKTEHLLEQDQMRKRLLELKYYSCFAIGFDEAKNQIDWYMN